MPTEPENVPKPETGVDGSVKTAEPPKPEKKIPTAEEYETLTREKDHLSQFASGVLRYTKRDADGNPESWDTEKILRDTIEDPAKVDQIMSILNGEKPANNPNPNPAPVNDPKAEFARLQADPVGFLKEYTQKVVDQVRADVQKEMLPIRNDVAGYKVRDMVAEVRAVHPDFDNHSQEILKIAQGRPPRSARDLESMYYEVLGRKGMAGNAANGNAGGNLGRTTQGQPKAGQPEKTYAEDVFDRMIHSGVPPENRSGKLTSLFGKDHLLPLKGE